jgi:hypothetical protein
VAQGVGSEFKTQYWRKKKWGRRGRRRSIEDSWQST